MILTAHQPVYMPWLGLFHKISLADSYCIFDDVQYTKKDFVNRNRIKTKNGPLWLTVPIESVNHRQLKVKDARIVQNGWQTKHFKSIQLAYSKSKYYSDYIDQIEFLFKEREWKYLADLNKAWLHFGLEILGINVKIFQAKDLKLEGVKSDLVADMCSKLGADAYIFGELGAGYADASTFEKIDVEIYFQKYEHPIYNQLHGEFVSNLSFIDLLFNEGPNSREVLMHGNLQSL
jgi:hypothetical protein